MQTVNVKSSKYNNPVFIFHLVSDVERFSGLENVGMTVTRLVSSCIAVQIGGSSHLASVNVLSLRYLPVDSKDFSASWCSVENARPLESDRPQPIYIGCVLGPPFVTFNPPNFLAAFDIPIIILSYSTAY